MPQQYLRYLILILLFTQCSLKEERIISSRKLIKINELNFPGKINRYFVDENVIHIHGSPYDNIRTYSEDGILLKEIGKKGPANWEISSVWFFEKTDSTYTIYDYGKNLINQFYLANDSLKISYKFNGRSNIMEYEMNKFIASQLNEKGEFEFTLLDITDKTQTIRIPIKNILDSVGIKDTKDLDFLLYGDFAKSDKTSDILIYYCLNAPIFFKIDLKNLNVNLFKDFRFEYMPETYRTGNNVVLTPNENWLVSGTVVGDEILFLTIENNEYYVERDSKWFLDIYNLETGIYKESIPVEMSNGEYFPFELRSRKEKLVIGWNFENIKTYEIKK